jgi:hypothetical protein
MTNQPISRNSYSLIFNTLDYDDEGRTLKKAGMPIETVREWKGKKAASG